MAVPAAMTRLASTADRRVGSHGRHQRLNDDEPSDEPAVPQRTTSTTNNTTGTATATSTSSGVETTVGNSGASIYGNTEAEGVGGNDDDHRTEEGEDLSRQVRRSARLAELLMAGTDDDHHGTEEGDDLSRQHLREVRRSRRLAELEEEREMSRRRTGICILIAVFVLFRLWIQALLDGDPGLLILCLVGTSWTGRWVRHNREREAEIDRRISEYMNNPRLGGDDDDEEAARADLSLMSFQAQLALAIMESQRQMLQGGHGHPDGQNSEERGVSDEAKARWERIEYNLKDIAKVEKGTTAQLSNIAGAVTKRLMGGYGSVPSVDNLKGDVESGDEQHHQQSSPDKGVGPESCSICLCDYEDGEELVRLPCTHLYHEECVTAWTSNHVRCPLCNYDLEEGGTPPLSRASSTSVPGDDSIV